MREPTKKEVLFAIKEQIRQLKRMPLPDEVYQSDEMRTFERMTSKFLKGEITQEEYKATVNDPLREEWCKLAREAGDPAELTAIDAESEADAKNLPPGANFLAIEATRYASEGLTKEEWICDVLKGHVEDAPGLTGDEAQLQALRLIVTLWSDGPWPWPRDLAPKE